MRYDTTRPLQCTDLREAAYSLTTAFCNNIYCSRLSNRIRSDIHSSICVHNHWQRGHGRTWALGILGPTCRFWWRTSEISLLRSTDFTISGSTMTNLLEGYWLGCRMKWFSEDRAIRLPFFIIGAKIREASWNRIWYPERSCPKRCTWSHGSCTNAR
jgi:hypothetical protein